LNTKTARTRTVRAVLFCSQKAFCSFTQELVNALVGFDKSAFTDKEISELAAYICFISACQKSGAFLDLQPSCSIL